MPIHKHDNQAFLDQINVDTLALGNIAYATIGDLWALGPSGWKNIHLATSGLITASFDGDTLLLSVASTVNDHNVLDGLQGGVAGSVGEFYHLTAAQYANILPTATLNNTLRGDGTNWLVSSFLLNTGTAVGVNKSTFGTVEKFGVNAAITVDNLACVQLTSIADANKPLVVQAYSATQSANLTEWQTSAGTVLDCVNASGYLGIGASGPTALLDVMASTNNSALIARIENHIANNTPPTITYVKSRGTKASPASVADQDFLGGFFFTACDSAPALRNIGYFGVRANGTIGNNSLPSEMYFGVTPGWNSTSPFADSCVQILISADSTVAINSVTKGTGQFNVFNGATGRVGVIVKGYSGQTVNLQEWQNSASACIARINNYVEYDFARGSGTENFAAGTSAGRALTTGGGNTLLGYGAGSLITEGNYNQILGSYAGAGLTTGSSNMLIGRATGYEIVTANNNVAIGGEAMRHGVGAANTFIGYSAGFGVVASTSASNTAIGSLAMGLHNGANECVAVGVSSLYNLASGHYNTALGRYSGFTNTTGAGNVFLGYTAGYYETGSAKLFIDTATRASEADGRIKALIYGVFDAAVANQHVQINGRFGVQANNSFGTVNRVTVNPNNTVDNAACVQINSAATGNKPLVVQGYSGQTANLQEWQDNGGNYVFNISAAGLVRWSAVTGTKAYLYDGGTGTQYGFGIQTSTLYTRLAGADGCFAIYQGGVHSASALDPGAGGTAAFVVNAAKNICLGGLTAAGTSATNTIIQKSGVAPAADVADAFQVYSADFAAGNACPTFRTELGTVIQLNQALATTASPSFVRLTLTQATGTSPLAITSTTVNTNLNADLLDGYHAGSNVMKTGFDAGTVGSTLVMNSSNFEVTTGSSYTVYSGGTAYVKSTTQSVAISNERTQHYVYFDTSGVIQVSTSPWDINSDNIPIATVYKNGSEYAIANERHFANRSQRWHEWAHSTIGARYEQGYVGTFTDTTLSLTQGITEDEDIHNNSGGTKTACRLWYRYTGAAAMVFESNITTPYKPSGGGVLQYDNAGTLTNATNNNYVCSYVYGTNDQDYPVYVVVGQAQYGTVALARNDTLPNLPGLTTAEWKLLYRVIYRNVGGTPDYIETADYRLVSTGPATNPATPGNHSALTGRDADNSHPATAIATDVTNFNGQLTATETDVQLALDKLDELNEGLQVLIDGQGFAVVAGAHFTVQVPYKCEIVSWTMLNSHRVGATDQISIELQRTVYADYGASHPVTGDKISASAPITLASAGDYKNTDSTLTGWTKTLAAGDILRFYVNSCTALTNCSISLTVKRKG